MAVDYMMSSMTRTLQLLECTESTCSTSPSGEKLTADIAVETVASDVPERRLGSPGGPLASKTFIFAMLQFRITHHNLS